jgi:hypothetical protein
VTAQALGVSGTASVTVILVNDAAVDSQSQVPTSMAGGQPYQVAVVMKNVGSTVWSSGGQYSLGTSSTIWGIQQVPIGPVSVLPGGTTTFVFTVTAPLPPPMSVTFNWQMMQNGKGYGEVSNSPVTLQLAPPAGLVPPDGSAFASTTTSVALSWNAVPGAASYKLQVIDKTDGGGRAPGNNCSPDPGIYLCRQNLTSRALAVPVLSGHDYHWTVQGVDSAGDAGLSAQAAFAVRLPAPDLSGVPSVLTLNSRISVAYPAAYTVDHFEWTFVPQSALGGSINAPALSGGISTAHFQTSRLEADLGSEPLTATTYDISVVAVDSLGNQSAPGSKVVSFVQETFANVKVYPNPWCKDRSVGYPITFDNLPANCTIKIFTVSSQWVATLSNVSGKGTWDLKNNHGDAVASGIYLYLITDGQGNKATGKFAIAQ